VLQWPVVFALVTLAIALIYYYAPDAKQDWVWITPGSVLATMLWVIISLAFKFYVANFGSYNATYGTIGGIIVLLTWFYLSGLAILIGAEVNAEIEHASPYGKDVGEKVPGEKRKIGPAAARAYEKRQARGEVDVPPFPDDVNCDVDKALTRKARETLRVSDLVIGAAVLAPMAAKIVKEIRERVPASARARQDDRDAA